MSGSGDYGSGCLWGILAIVLVWYWWSDDAPRAWTKSDITNIAKDQADAISGRRVSELTSRVEELESKLQAQESSLNNVRELGLAAFNANESLRKTFNHNVDLDNNERIKRMTASGACGQQQVNYPDGSWTIKNKECTLKDLK